MKLIFFYGQVLWFFLFNISAQGSVGDMIAAMDTSFIKKMVAAKERHESFLKAFFRHYGALDSLEGVSELSHDELTSEFKELKKGFLDDFDRYKKDPFQWKLAKAAQDVGFVLEKDLPEISFFLLKLLFKVQKIPGLMVQFATQKDFVLKSRVELKEQLKPLLDVFKVADEAYLQPTKSTLLLAQNLLFLVTYQTNDSFEACQKMAQDDYFIRRVFFRTLDNVPEKNIFADIKPYQFVSEYEPSFSLPQPSRNPRQQVFQLNGILERLQILVAPQGIQSFLAFNQTQYEAFYAAWEKAGYQTDPMDLTYYDDRFRGDYPLGVIRLLQGSTYLGPHRDYETDKRKAIQEFSKPLRFLAFLDATDAEDYVRSYQEIPAIRVFRKELLTAFFKNFKKGNLETYLGRHSKRNLEHDLELLKEYQANIQQAALSQGSKQAREIDEDTKAIEAFQKSQRPLSKREKAKQQAQAQKRTAKNKKKPVVKNEPKNTIKSTVSSQKKPKKRKQKNVQPQESFTPVSALTEEDGVKLTAPAIESDEELRQRLAQENRQQLMKAQNEIALIPKSNSVEVAPKKEKRKFWRRFFSSTNNSRPSSSALPLPRIITNVLGNYFSDELRNLFSIQNRQTQEVLRKQATALAKKHQRHLGGLEQEKLRHIQASRDVDQDLNRLEVKLLEAGKIGEKFSKSVGHYHEQCDQIRQLINYLWSFYYDEISDERLLFEQIVAQQSMVIRDYNTFVTAHSVFREKFAHSQLKDVLIQEILESPEKQYNLKQIACIHERESVIPERVDQQFFHDALWQFHASHEGYWDANTQSLKQLIERLRVMHESTRQQSAELLNRLAQVRTPVLTLDEESEEE